MTPMKLPKRDLIPVSLRVSGKVVDDRDEPSALRRITLEFDRNGAINPGDYAVCSRGQLSRPGGLRSCRDAVVATGVAHVALHGVESVPVSLTAINGGSNDGIAKLFVIPTSTSSPVGLTVAVVELTTMRKGPYGLRAVAQIPPIAGGAGRLHDFVLRFGRTVNSDGAHSYIEARCRNGHLLARVISYVFADGRRLHGESTIRPCLADT